MHSQMNGTVDLKPKTGPDVKDILQSIKIQQSIGMKQSSRSIACNPAKMFKSTIQRANDSGSLDASLEYKSLPNSSVEKRFDYVNELRQVLKENQHIEAQIDSAFCKKHKTNENNVITSKLPFVNRKNIENKYLIVSKSSVCEQCNNKNVNLLKTNRNMPINSTPYKSKQENDLINSNVEKISTPSLHDKNAIDSRCEAIYNEFDQQSNLNCALVKCFSLTRNSCRRISSFHDSSKKQNKKPFERQSLFTSSFNSIHTKNRFCDVSKEELLQREKNTKNKNSKLLDLFRTSKTKINDSQKSAKNSFNDLCNSNSCQFLLQTTDNELGCASLTKYNLDIHTANQNNLLNMSSDCDQTIDWGDKFEFSFICEPSTSDNKDNDEDSFCYSNEVEVCANRKNSFRIPSIELNQTRSESDNFINSSPFRRSISDPALLRLANIRFSDENQPNHATGMLTDDDRVSLHPNYYSANNVVSFFSFIFCSFTSHYSRQFQ